MSSETDHPRQRTVAELLAEHGNGGASGRRRRRRESDDPDEGAPPGRPPLATREPGPPVTDRAEPRDPVAPGVVPRQGPAPAAVPPTGRPADGPGPAAPEPDLFTAPAGDGQVPNGRPANGRSAPPQPVFGPAPAAPAPARPPAVRALPPVRPAEPPAGRAAAPRPPAARPDRVQPDRAQPDAGPERDRPTDVMPRYRDDAPVEEDLFTRPIPQQQSAPADDPDAGPSTMVGAAPVGAEAWHRARTQDAVRDGAEVDDAPPLPAGPVGAGEEPAGLGAPVDLRKHPDGPPPRERRLGRGAAAKGAAAPTWAAVVVQWVAGALGGAVLWVLFRFLWRNLPVVALASAVLVTVGLVVIVRALLHNDDRRTTIFAVLVGLLLTVSPAILVLMGR
ncbi:hypothetical protein [Pseudonocardia hydrocarbonoxydans]|uniref:Uncharacterized protein n=1 Tax=Pseudonocardia hydrocarbonoxydans TaxID=76726 RepID=A0A4Y3WSQ4_9PSEU|nr:hypothetical protein [Pseudonocardia hydrocarbonoxydans]GEC20809.1 hypothetical protein PHY01_30920 [Pseudonocardia hydrocarbonoxydans]